MEQQPLPDIALDPALSAVIAANAAAASSSSASSSPHPAVASAPTPSGHINVPATAQLPPSTAAESAFNQLAAAYAQQFNAAAAAAAAAASSGQQQQQNFGHDIQTGHTGYYGQSVMSQSNGNGNGNGNGNATGGIQLDPQLEQQFQAHFHPHPSSSSSASLLPVLDASNMTTAPAGASAVGGPSSTTSTGASMRPRQNKRARIDVASPVITSGSSLPNAMTAQEKHLQQQQQANAQNAAAAAAAIALTNAAHVQQYQQQQQRQQQQRQQTAAAFDAAALIAASAAGSTTGLNGELGSLEAEAPIPSSLHQPAPVPSGLSNAGGGNVSDTPSGTGSATGPSSAGRATTTTTAGKKRKGGSAPSAAPIEIDPVTGKPSTRKERNRLAAQRSRDRKAAEFDRLGRVAQERELETKRYQDTIAEQARRIEELEAVIQAIQGGPVRDDQLDQVRKSLPPPSVLSAAASGDSPLPTPPVSAPVTAKGKMSNARSAGTSQQQQQQQQRTRGGGTGAATLSEDNAAAIQQAQAASALATAAAQRQQQQQQQQQPQHGDSDQQESSLPDPPVDLYATGL